MAKEKRTCDSKNRTYIGVYFHDGLYNIMRKHQRTIEDMTGDRPAMSAMVNQAMKDYLSLKHLITKEDEIPNFLEKKQKRV